MLILLCPGRPLAILEGGRASSVFHEGETQMKGHFRERAVSNGKRPRSIRSKASNNAPVIVTWLLRRTLDMAWMIAA